MMGLQFAMLLGGAVLTETTFSWPGLGDTLWTVLTLKTTRLFKEQWLFSVFSFPL